LASSGFDAHGKTTRKVRIPVIVTADSGRS
jgi:hypothetical protein